MIMLKTYHGVIEHIDLLRYNCFRLISSFKFELFGQKNFES